jgi:hypothetical protein
MVCPYNATHHIPTSEEIEHLQRCPDKVVADIQKYRLNAAVPGKHGNLTGPLVFGSSNIPYAPMPDIQDKLTSKNGDVKNTIIKKIQPSNSTSIKNNSIISPIEKTRHPKAQNLNYQVDKDLIWSTKYVRSEQSSTTVKETDSCINSSLYMRSHGGLEENPFIQTSIRGRSPSPTASSRSIPRLHRFGKLTTSDSTIPPPALRRPRIAINPDSNTWQSFTKSDS